MLFKAISDFIKGLVPRGNDIVLRKAFSSVKHEFEEHLDAINENTNEIQSNYELLLKLESRIEKIEANLNEIERFIKQFKSQNVYFLEEDSSEAFNILPLSDEEKKVFKVLYELDAQGIKVTYPKLADVVGISTSLAREYITSLIEKGVPIAKSYLHQSVYLGLETRFKDIQTKKNIVGL